MTSPQGDDMGTTSAVRGCPVCGTRFVRVRRQQYCSAACRRRAYKRRHAPTAAASPALPPRRRDITVYECGDCGERYLGLQWCDGCQRPCRRIGLGGACPACDHPVTVDDLLSRH